MTPPTLRREIGLPSAILLVVGSVIGSGIFVKPLAIAKALPSPEWIYAVWIGLGAICLIGAFAYAELGAMFPEAGGQYAFLREAWGLFPAFLYGWCLLLVINTGTLAALAVKFGDALVQITVLPEGAVVPIAIGMILLLATVNHFGVKFGAALQNISTVAKLVALGAIAWGAFLIEPAKSLAADVVVASPANLLSGLVAAAVAIFWAYEGWHQLAFSAAEMKRPERTLPLGLIIGVILLVFVYVAMNAVYLHAVPQGEMVGLKDGIEVPQLTVARAYGQEAAAWVVALIALSVFGAANPNLLSATRSFYAMAQDGILPARLMHVSPRFGTPVLAIWSQAVWSIVLVFVLRNFEDITEYVVFAALLFYGLVVAGVYVLRRKRPDRPRPFRMPGYPLTPALFLLVVFLVDAWTIIEPTHRKNALYGLGILLVGIPAFFILRRRP